MSYDTILFFQKQGIPVDFVCQELNIARSAFYKHMHRVIPKKQRQDELVSTLIQEYHVAYDGILGYRRMSMFINRLNQTTYSEAYIHRLMKKLNIKARIRVKKINRVRSRPDYVKENILARDFKADTPNQKWLTDITEFSIPHHSRKLYLSPILDLFDNSIIDYELSFRNTNEVVFKMFDRAILKYPHAKPIFHSDRGFQYTNTVFKSKLESQGMNQSMSRVGKCIDNGPMEAFFGTLKSEIFYGKTFESMDELIIKIKQYIQFYNEERFQKKLKSLSPLEYRRQAFSSF